MSDSSSSPSRIPEALTAEEWAVKRVSVRGMSLATFELERTHLVIENDTEPDDDGFVSNRTYLADDARHPLAALCLYGQPFGSQAAGTA